MASAKLAASFMCWFLAGRNMLHLLLALIMTWLGLKAMEPSTFYSSFSATHWWFLQHPPYTGFGWGLVFLVCAACGWLGLLGNTPWLHLHDWEREIDVSQTRATQHKIGAWLQLVGCTIMGCGHAMMAYGIRASNPSAWGYGTYWLLALASVGLLINIGISEDPGHATVDKRGQG